MESRSKKFSSLILSLILFLQLCKGEIGPDMNYKSLNKNYEEGKDDVSVNRLNLQSIELHDGQFSQELIATKEKRTTSLVTSLLPSVIMTSIGITISLNCGAYATSMQANLHLCKRMETVIISKRHKVNLHWNKVISMNKHIEKLNSSLDVLEKQMDQLYTLEEDAIVLLDPNIYNRITKILAIIEVEITKSNKTVIDLKRIRQRATSANVFVMNAFISLHATGAAFLFTRYYTKSRVKAITRRQVKVWVRRNTKVFTDKQMKFKGVNLKVDAGTKRLIRADKKRPVLERKIRYKKSKAECKKIIRKAKIRGALISGAIVFVAQLSYTIYHITNCMKKDKRVKKMVMKLKEIENNIDLIQHNITIVEKKLENAYKDLAKRLQDKSFFEFVDNAYEIAKRASKKSAKMNLSRKQIEYFKLHIRTVDFDSDSVDFIQVEKSIRSLASGMKLVNKFVYCNNYALKIFFTAINNCKKGKKKAGVTTIFETSFEKYHKMCNFDVYSKTPNVQLNEMLSKSMPKANKSDICIRNNALLNEVVCSNWHKGIHDIENANKVSLTVDDVIYMKSKCSAKVVTDDVRKSICLEKSTGKSLNQVLKEFKKYQERTIKSTYSACAFSSFQKQTICRYKNEGKTLKFVADKLKHYDINMVHSIFKGCVKTLNGGQIAFICTLKAIRKINNPYNPLLLHYTMEFGAKAVKNVLKNRCWKLF